MKNYDCPWCGISLKWRYVPSKPLNGQREILPLFATPVCPSCGERLTTNIPAPEKRDWRWWCSNIILVMSIVVIWSGNKVLAYSSAGIIFVLVIIDYLLKKSNQKNAEIIKHYRKYECLDEDDNCNAPRSDQLSNTAELSEK